MESYKAAILLIVSAQGFLLSAALISAIIKRNYSNFFLGIIVFVISIEMLNAWGVVVGYHGRPNPFPFWILGSYLSLPPALWFFMKINTQPKFQVKTIHVLYFLPAFIEIIIEFTSSYIRRSTGIQFSLINNPIWFTFSEIIPPTAMLLVLICFGFGLWVLSKKLENTSAKSISLHIRKLYSFWGLFSLFTILWFIQGIIGYHIFELIEIVFSIFLFTLGFIGYFHPPFFEVPNLEPKHFSKEEFHQYQDPKELRRLNQLFEEEKIYTQAKLSLDEIAQKLKLPPRYISHLINTYHQTNFRNFVNSFRVQEALSRIQNPKENHKTLLAIALESGFNSKSSFNHIFKSFTGKTPSNYLKKPINKS